MDQDSPFVRSYAGVLHKFGRNVSAFEHASGGGARNTVIFVGGMYGSLVSTAYTASLAAAVPGTWRLIDAELSSARTGFGTGSLTKDVAELQKLVKYLRTSQPNRTQRVVLVGHSTGCQDVLLYASTPSDANCHVSAVALQAPVSDRESLRRPDGPSADAVAAATAEAKKLVADKKDGHVLPLDLTVSAFGPVPLSAKRWLSLAELGGDDDFFSSDLEDEHLDKTFGALAAGCRILVVPSAADEAVGPGYDWLGQLRRWEQAVKRGKGVWDDASALLEGANHDISEGGEQVVAGFVKRVVELLGRVEGGKL